VSAFWNISVDNEGDRYSIGSATDDLSRNRDGSLTLHIQQDGAADQLAKANCLLAPGGLFNLTMRLYGPATSALDGTYRLPPVRRRASGERKH
jgi:hypothetical protein